MKAILLTLSLALCSSYCYSQGQVVTELPKFNALVANAPVAMTAEPFKPANVVYIITTDSASTALKKLARAFVTQGFTIDKLDSEIGYLTTTGKQFGEITPATFTYKAVVEPTKSGNLLVISGDVKVNRGIQQPLVFPMTWVKSTLRQDRLAFDWADKAAKAYPGGQVGYWQR